MKFIFTYQIPDYIYTPSSTIEAKDRKEAFKILKKYLSGINYQIISVKEEI